MSEKAHTTAVLALLNAAAANAYTIDELDAMGSLPPQYAEVYVTNRSVDAGRRVSGRSGSTDGWRVQVRAVANRFGNAQEIRRRVHAALKNARVTVDGRTSSPMWQSVSDDPIASDDGWFSGMSEYEYAH